MKMAPARRLARTERQIYSSFLTMTASLRRMLRVLGTCVLGAAVPLAASASAPVQPATAGQMASAAEAARAVSISSALPMLSFETRAFEDVEVQLTGPANSAGHRYNRRISAEDTTPPSLDALEASRLRVPMEPEARPRPAPPVHRSAVGSPATRQRAP